MQLAANFKTINQINHAWALHACSVKAIVSAVSRNEKDREHYKHCWPGAQQSALPEKCSCHGTVTTPMWLAS